MLGYDGDVDETPPQDGSQVEKRMRFQDRHRERWAEGAPAETLMEAQGSGEANRHGMPRVPIGQRMVPNWPVLDLGVQPEIAAAEWRLEVCGLVEQPITLDLEALLALPQVEEASDFHCVTTWSLMDTRFGGVRFRDLADAVRPLPEARFLLCTGYDADPDSGEAFTTNLSLEDAMSADVLLAHHWQGEPLPRDHGGPVRMITPRLYAWKGTKWLRKIEFMAEDQLGFWERRGYSNTARPWNNDRYSD